jgi:hypothetical protein
LNAYSHVGHDRFAVVNIQQLDIFKSTLDTCTDYDTWTAFYSVRYRHEASVAVNGSLKTTCGAITLTLKAQMTSLSVAQQAIEEQMKNASGLLERTRAAVSEGPEEFHYSGCCII